MKYILHSVEETNSFGHKLGAVLKVGDVVCLNGDLGSGKTTLTKAIGEELGIEDYITSPTFTIINVYKGNPSLYHFDTYRLEEKADIVDLGFDDYLFGDGICIIEWADKIKDILPDHSITINLKYLEEGQRSLEILKGSERAREVIEEMDI